MIEWYTSICILVLIQSSFRIFPAKLGNAREVAIIKSHFKIFSLQKRVEGTEEFRIQTMVTLVTNVISLAFLLPSFFIMTVALSR